MPCWDSVGCAGRACRGAPGGGEMGRGVEGRWGGVCGGRWGPGGWVGRVRERGMGEEGGTRISKSMFVIYTYNFSLLALIWLLVSSAPLLSSLLFSFFLFETSIAGWLVAAVVAAVTGSAPRSAPAVLEPSPFYSSSPASGVYDLQRPRSAEMDEISTLRLFAPPPLTSSPSPTHPVDATPVCPV